MLNLDECQGGVAIHSCKQSLMAGLAVCQQPLKCVEARACNPTVNREQSDGDSAHAPHAFLICSFTAPTVISGQYFSTLSDKKS